MTRPSILIAGAGPTGLSAAIELCRRGFTPRIVERKEKPSPLSRAVGINARSLELLEPSGVTDLLLSAGIKIPYVQFHEKGRVLTTFPLHDIPHRYNFMLALPQDQTEHILQNRLREYGTKTEYGTELSALTLQDGKALVTLQSAGQQTHHSFDLVIGADGSHSTVRQCLDIPFEGYDYDRRWSIADFESRDWPYTKNVAHGFVGDNGTIGVAIPIGPDRFRGVSDQPETLPCIPGDYTVDEIRRADSFVISVRQAATYQKGCVYLAGDAAHVHSPVGGRGMNLGIEDACELAQRLAGNDLEGYTDARRPAGEKVIRVSERLVRIVTATHPVFAFFRRIFMRVLPMIPPLKKSLLRFASGL